MSKRRRDTQWLAIVTCCEHFHGLEPNAMPAIGHCSDRRRACRDGLCVLGIAELNGHGKDVETREIASRDISGLGAFIEMTKPFPLGSELKIWLLMGKHLVNANGSVVRINQEGMGVSFSRTEFAASTV